MTRPIKTTKRSKARLLGAGKCLKKLTFYTLTKVVDGDMVFVSSPFYAFRFFAGLFLVSAIWCGIVKPDCLSFAVIDINSLQMRRREAANINLSLMSSLALWFMALEEARAGLFIIFNKTAQQGREEDERNMENIDAHSRLPVKFKLRGFFYSNSTNVA